MVWTFRTILVPSSLWSLRPISLINTELPQARVSCRAGVMWTAERLSASEEGLFSTEAAGSAFLSRLRRRRSYRPFLRLPPCVLSFGRYLMDNLGTRAFLL